MIIGNDRLAVIENIRAAAEKGDFYAKVELNDPVLTDEESEKIVERYLQSRNTPAFRVKSFAARRIADTLTFALNKNTKIVGLEKAANLTGGAFITSNHFSPVENTAIRRMVRKLGKKRLPIVSQITNLAMPGIVGFLMNYADVIPLSDDLQYMHRDFSRLLEEFLEKGEYILIYPEQEMWFHYKKPRPPKRGTYHFAARLNAPVISCFVEQRSLPEKDTAEFSKVQFIVHVLGVLYPDLEKSVKENSREMCQKDYALKKAAYEKAYGKPLDYGFENTDIAGWLGELQ